MKGVQRFGVKGKLAPRYVGPFPIIERCGPVAYRLELPAQISAAHNIFHVSQLRRCLRVPEKVIDIEKLQLEPDLFYPEYPIKIVDHKTRVTRNQTSDFYKVQWSNHSEREATWETDEFVQSKCPELLQAYRGTHKVLTLPFCRSLNLRARFLLGGRIVTPASPTVREGTADSPPGIAQIFIWMGVGPTCHFSLPPHSVQSRPELVRSPRRFPLSVDLPHPATKPRFLAREPSSAPPPPSPNP